MSPADRLLALWHVFVGLPYEATDLRPAFITAGTAVAIVLFTLVGFLTRQWIGGLERKLDHSADDLMRAINEQCRRIEQVQARIEETQRALADSRERLSAVETRLADALRPWDGHERRRRPHYDYEVEARRLDEDEEED